VAQTLTAGPRGEARRVSGRRTRRSTHGGADARWLERRSTAARPAGAATAPRHQRAPARRTCARTPGTARANARRPRRPAREEAAAAACPHARAGRPSPDPTASRRDALAPTEDPARAAATSSANSGSDAARARPP